MIIFAFREDECEKDFGKGWEYTVSSKLILFNNAAMFNEIVV